MKIQWSEVEGVYGDMDLIGTHRSGGAQYALAPFSGPMVSAWVSANATEEEGKKIAEAGLRAMRKEMKRLDVEACAFLDRPEGQGPTGGG